MAKFIVRRILLLMLTMILVSLAVFLITESSPGNVARNVLGAFVTPEQEASFMAQVGLDKPVWVRYVYWLLGSDWSAEHKVGMPLKRITTAEGFVEWWVFSVVSRCIVHINKIVQPDIQTVILLYLTSFKEFAALAESDKIERGP